MAYTSRRCPDCGTNWPFTTAYLFCRDCQKETWPSEQPADVVKSELTYAERAELARLQAAADELRRKQSDAINGRKSKTPYSDQHPDKTETQELPVVAPSPSYVNRLEHYGELGFTEAEAHLLASATRSITVTTKLRTHTYEGLPLSWHDVAAALARGATRAQVVAIYA